MGTLSAATLPVSAPGKLGNGTKAFARHRKIVQCKPIRVVQTSGTRLSLKGFETIHRDPADLAKQLEPHKIQLANSVFIVAAADVGITATDSHKAQPKPSTMFQKLGGAPAIQGVVDEFYTRVFADDEVKGFFEGISRQRLNKHQVCCAYCSNAS